MEEGVTYYLVMLVKHWDSIEPEDPKAYPPIIVRPSPGCVGFLPVYDDIEAAKRDYPGAQIQSCTGGE